MILKRGVALEGFTTETRSPNADMHGFQCKETPRHTTAAHGGDRCVDQMLIDPSLAATLTLDI